jgi:APA family basic amino acid/polyamine antiporter
VDLKRQIGLTTAVFIIIADVIGTGIFMTTGNVLGMTGNALSVMILWGIGGLVALTGSLCYAELASIWPQSGGEYVYLRNIYGYLPSFLTGWISLVVGFTASAAISAMLVIIYLNEFIQGGVLAGVWTQKILASLIVVFFAAVHIFGVRRGSLIQNLLTILKILLVFSLIAFGFYAADWGSAERLTAVYESAKDKSIIEYGSALLVIMYAYSGWNGTSYIAGEIKDPARNLPRAMFFGVLIVGLIYMLLNIVYLISSPGPDLMGKDAVGAIAAKNLFGEGISPVFTLGIALVLLSSVSVQIMVGPRVYHAMAGDGLIFRFLDRINPKYHTPDTAIVIQAAITILYIFLGMGNVISLLIYLGFALGIFPLMAVIGLVYVRIKRPELSTGFKVPLFPLIPLVYILLTAGMMLTSLITSYKTVLTALGVVFLGIVIYFFWTRKAMNTRE